MMYTINVTTDRFNSIIINGTEDVTLRIIEECTPIIDNIVQAWNEIRLIHPSYENYHPHCEKMNEYTNYILDLFKQLDKHGMMCSIDYDTKEDMILTIW